MYSRIRRALDSKDSGFTLIELLTVIVIIGILAAIAIPIFLTQRRKAVDASAKADAHNIALQMETFYTNALTYPDNNTYAFAAPTVTIGAEKVAMSPGNLPSVYLNGSDTAFCVSVDNPGKVSHPFVWQSDNGGLQSNAAADCSAYSKLLK